MIVISMFCMFQEVYFCTVLYDCNFYVLYVQEVYFYTVLYDFNFYALEGRVVPIKLAKPHHITSY